MSTPDPQAQPLALAFVQLVVPASLSARVPAAVRRGTEAAQALWASLVAETQGKQAASDTDGWVASWRHAPNAARCVLRFQEELLELDWPPTLLTRPEARPEKGEDGALLYRGLRARAGLHHGTPEVHDQGGRTLYGPAVHQLARITTTAHGGQTVASQRCWRQVASATDLDIQGTDLGAHRLPGTPGLVHLYQLMPPGLSGRSFGPLATLGHRQTNVVADETAFLGREGDLSAIAELLGFGVHLVTVTGPRGVGKSRLVHRFAWLHRAEYTGEGAGGAWVVDLDDATTREEMVTAIGHALDIPLVIGHTLDDCVAQLGHALRGAGRQLVILDGVDRVLDDARQVLGRWLEEAHDVAFVVSCRERLQLPGEVAYELSPLPLPEGQRGRHTDSIRLMEARARLARPGFTIDSLDTISELVQRLRGNPLAIELAASTMATSSPGDLLELLPATSVRRLVYGIAEQTWNHLAPDQQKMLRRLSVFRGGFDLRSAEAVCDMETPDMTKLVEALVTRGLVRRFGLGDAPGVRRFTLRRPIREYAWGKVEEDERFQLWRRYGHAVIDRCTPWLDHIHGADGPEILARLALEWENLLAIARWGLLSDDLDPDEVNLGIQAVLLILPILRSQGPFPVEEALLDAAVAAADAVLGADPIHQVRVLRARARVRRGRGQAEAARGELERAQSIADRWNDPEGVGMCLLGLSEVWWELDSPVQAAQLLEDAAQRFREEDNRFYEGQVVAATGLFHLEGGRLPFANDHLHLALAMFREVGAKHFEARTLGNLGVLNRRQGRFDEARSLYRQSIELHQQIGNRREQASLLGNLGVLDYHLGRMEAARKRFTEARTIARAVGDISFESLSLGNLGLVDLEAGDPDDARQTLLASLALARQAGDLIVEGLVSGYLALLHQRSGRAPSARDYYSRAIRLLEEANDRRARGLFLAWFAVLEAEQDDLDKAERLFKLSKKAVKGIKEPPLHDTLGVLRIAVDFARARAHAAAGETIPASRIWKEVETRLEKLDDREILHGDLRLATGWLRDSLDAVGV